MIYIILPVHNRLETTRQFISCLLRQKNVEYRLILINDGCTDGTDIMVRSAIPNVVEIRGQGDWWWGGSLQQGFLWAKEATLQAGDEVLLINDDTLFAGDFLENCRRALHAAQGALLIATGRDEQGGVIQGGMKIDWLRIRFRLCGPGEEADCSTTRGLFMRAQDFLAIGGFWPRLLPHYLSDIEFTVRARRRGLRIVTDESVRVQVDARTTGEHHIRERSLIAYVRRLFSRRASHNPLYMTSFLFLAAPWWAIPHGLVKVWLLPFVEFFGLRRSAPQG